MCLFNQERVQRAEDEFMDIHTFQPLRDLTLEDVREFEDYAKTQTDYVEKVRAKVKLRQEEKESKIMAELKQKPKISAKTKQIANKRQNSEIEVHERLNKSGSSFRDRKFDQNKVYRPDSGLNQTYKGVKASKITEKLFEDSKKREFDSKLSQKSGQRKNEVVFKSKLNNFSNFYKDFTKSLVTLFNEPELELSRQEFSEILKLMGFTYFTLEEIREVYSNDAYHKHDKLRAEEEKVNFENAWKIMTLNEDTDSVHSNQVLVFLAAMCGNFSDPSKQADKSSVSKSQVSKSSKSTQANVFAKVLPNFDYNKYKYPPDIVSKIRTCFFYLVNNRNKYNSLVNKEKHLRNTRYEGPNLKFCLEQYTNPQFDNTWKEKYVEKWRERLVEFYSEIGEETDWLLEAKGDKIIEEINKASRQ